MSRKSIYISFLSLFILFTACNSDKKVYESSTSKKKKRFEITIGKFNKMVKNGDMDAKYAAAVKYFDKEDYTKALTLFEELMAVYRGTERGEEVHYYYAYCNYNVGDYIVAGYQFRNYVRNYPDTKHTEECAYMNAYCFYLNSPEYSLDQIDTKLAIKEFQNFVVHYPKSDRIPKCNEQIDQLRGKLERKSYENAMLFYNMQDYRAAITCFNNHVKDFPGSEKVEEVTYLTIKSYYLLALNSIESKKQERFKAVVDTYFKFVDAFPKSTYLKDAEMVYDSAVKNIEKYNKSRS